VLRKLIQQHLDIKFTLGEQQASARQGLRDQLSLSQFIIFFCSISLHINQAIVDIPEVYQSTSAEHHAEAYIKKQFSQYCSNMRKAILTISNSQVSIFSYREISF
jgi:hypothetical protein